MTRAGHEDLQPGLAVLRRRIPNGRARSCSHREQRLLAFLSHSFFSDLQAWFLIAPSQVGRLVSALLHHRPASRNAASIGRGADCTQRGRPSVQVAQRSPALLVPALQPCFALPDVALIPTIRCCKHSASRRQCCFSLAWLSVSSTYLSPRRQLRVNQRNKLVNACRCNHGFA